MSVKVSLVRSSSEILLSSWKANTRRVSVQQKMNRFIHSSTFMAELEYSAKPKKYNCAERRRCEYEFELNNIMLVS